MNKLNSILLCLLLLFAMPLHAQLSNWQSHDSGQVRLIASNKASADGALYAALQLQLKPGWHTYWRSPGDAGLAPAPEWKEAVNLEKAELLFTYPQSYDEQGLTTNGYEGEVIYPIRITLKDAHAATELKTKVSFLVCSDICIPAEFNLALSLPAGFQSVENDEASSAIKSALALVPQQDNGTGFTLKSASLVMEGGVLALKIAYDGANVGGELRLFIENGDGSTLPIAGLSNDTANKMAVARLKADAPKDLAGKEKTFTLIDVGNHRAVEKKLSIVADAAAPASAAPAAAAPSSPPAPSSSPAPENPKSLFAMLLLALLGGLVLNLMPCVLPVLALKSLSFIQHGGGTPSGVRLSFLATSAGILFSFLVMAGALIGLKEAGMSVGWGVQFQHPVFLVFLVVILLLFSLNLWGLFEIPLPRFLADRLSWTQGHGSLTKDFLSGAFATLLATPCTAPFLGTAVGFALAGGAVEILAIFMALGLGLAAPFILIALFPATATWLPKPGAWMNGLRKFLAALLMLTALWLGYVLAAETALMPKEQENAEWQAFDETKIPALVQEGRIVLVDVTADWCLTCQANKKFVLETEAMRKTLSAPAIVKMKADWTRRDEKIGAYLKSFGRYGIPFNIVYGPASPQGMPLPELLSREAVLEGLKKAGFAP